MLDTGTFYVVTVGRRYLRYPYDSKKPGLGCIIARQLEHAHRFETMTQATDQALELYNDEKHEPNDVGVQAVSVKSVPVGTRKDALKKRRKHAK